MALAAVADGKNRAEAAAIGLMDRQTLRDWIIRFNEQGLEQPDKRNRPDDINRLQKTGDQRSMISRTGITGIIPTALYINPLPRYQKRLTPGTFRFPKDWSFGGVAGAEPLISTFRNPGY